VTIARLDPDGLGFRMAMKRGFKINVQRAGHNLIIDLLGVNWRGRPPPIPQDIIDELAAKAEQVRIEREKRARQEIAMEGTIGDFYELSNPIESYMFYQGKKFAERFDANSYLRIMDMWQRFSLNAEQPDLFKDCRHQQYLIFSVDSDVCFYPEEQKVIVNALEAAQMNVKYITVHSDKGHDSFLLEPDLYAPYIHFILG
jgi:homoserine acetyltransferase